MAIKAPSRARNKHVPKHAPAKKTKPKKGFFRRFWWVFLATPFLMLLVVAAALFIAYQRITLPDTLPPIQTSYLLDRNGNLLASLHGSVDRTIVPLSKISLNLQHAVIATEDAGFYSNPGIDVKGILRAAWTDIVHHRTQGASTITEQLVKNVYAGQYVRNADGSTDYVLPPRTIKEKIREALLAVKLDKTYSKDQILAKYLNTVYFGHGAYGAEAAAETYFGRHASQLTVLESASMAGVLHSPGPYDPITNPSDNKFRRDYSMQQMVRYGYLDATTEAKLQQRRCCGTVPDTTDQIQAPYGSAYFIDYARQYLFDRYGSARVYGGGLHVTTSLDMRLQKAAWDSVRQNLPFTSTNPSAAVVSIDPKTGQILAMVGGRNFDRSKLNLATFQGGTGREAGSAFKAFTLAAALENGYSLNKYWVGPSQITINNPICNGPSGPWQPINAEPTGSTTTFSLLQATEHSVNTVFAQLVAQLGPQKVVEMAHRLGIRSSLPDVCAITLGNVAINPLEMTNAYATLDDRGVLRRATPLVAVDNQRGTSLDDVTSGGHQVLDPNLANEVTYALRAVVLGGTGTAAGLYPWPVAGKTGTANGNVDAWFCGYTAQLVTCVWVGYPKGEIPLVNVEGVPSVYGGTIPAAIWHDYMALAMKGDPAVAFPTATLTGTLGPTAPVASPTPSPTPSPSPSPTLSPSPSVSPSPSPSPSPTGSPSPTTSPTPRLALRRGRDP